MKQIIIGVKARLERYVQPRIEGRILLFVGVRPQRTNNKNVRVKAARFHITSTAVKCMDVDRFQ
jgi:hypothetical protein